MYLAKECLNHSGRLERLEGASEEEGSLLEYFIETTSILFQNRIWKLIKYRFYTFGCAVILGYWT